MKEDRNVYKKIGRKYVPIGMKLDDNWLNDGIWVVRHRDGCKSITRGDYLADSYGLIKAGELAKVDLPMLGGLEAYAEVVASTIGKLEGQLANIDVARRIVKDLFDYCDKSKK